VFVGVFVWGVGVLFLSCVCVCVSVSGVLFSVGVCVTCRSFYSNLPTVFRQAWSALLASHGAASTSAASGVEAAKEAVELSGGKHQAALDNSKIERTEAAEAAVRIYIYIYIYVCACEYI